MNAALRPAVSEDAPAIAAVHIETWQSIYRGQLPDTYLDNLGQDLVHRTEVWQSWIATSDGAAHEIWVAEIHHRIEGFVAFGLARDDDSERTGEVYAIYVHPRSWTQGIGRMLFSHATRRLAARGYSKARLWVLESNAQARRFYEIAGWSVDGRTKTENHPEGIALKEVSYFARLQRENEE
jgi:ribosomal protein S18 acetylase RimI-like enzyme